MSEEFKPGDLVQLKSGGAAMVVDDVKADRAECVWSDKSGKPHRQFYSFAALKAADPDLADVLTQLYSYK